MKPIKFLEAICFFAIFIALSSGDLQFNENVHFMQESGSNCILGLATQYFTPFSILAIVKSNRRYPTNLTLAISTEDIIMQKLTRPANWSIVTKFTGEGAEQEFQFGFEKVHNYVIMFQSLKDLENVLKFLSSVNSWNPHAKFLLFVVGFVPDWPTLATNVIRVFWQFWVVNVVILFPLSTIMAQLVITYFPFDKGDCGKQEKNFQVIGMCNMSVVHPVGRNFYPEKVPSDFNNCLVKVGTVNSPPFVIDTGDQLTGPRFDLNTGIEMRLMKTLAERVNFNVELQFSYLADDRVLGGRNETGGLLDGLAERRFDIAIGTISPTISDHERFDFSVQYTQDMAAWVVPSDEMVPKWMRLLVVFKPHSYAITFAMLIFFCCATWAIMKTFKFNFKQEFSCYKDRSTFFLIAVGMLFANIPKHFPRTKFLRYIVFMWLLFCLHWDTAYNATLMSVVTKTVSMSGMETESEIVGLNMKMMATNRTIRYFQQLLQDPLQSNSRKLQLCTAVPECLRVIQGTTNTALAMSRLHFEYLKQSVKHNDGDPKVKMLKSNIATSPIEMLLSKGNPLLSRINQILLEVVESGLIDYWARNITRSLLIENSGAQLTAENTITVQHLTGVFVVLGIGLFIATIVFILELVYFYGIKKRKCSNATTLKQIGQCHH